MSEATTYLEYDFDDLEYDKPSNTIYGKGTGEIIDDKTTIEKAIEDHDKQVKYDKAKKKEFNKKLGKVYKEDTHHFGWKSGKKVQFIKIYRTEMREYKKSIKLSSNAGLLLFYIQDYIEFETNRIAKPDGSTFTNKELQALTGLSDKPLRNALNELEDLFFIKRVGQGKAREIYFNPYLMCSGVAILKEVVDVLFKDYKPCTAY